MKYLLLFLLLAGCATTTEPTLDSLMRSSYLIGCEDEGAVMAINQLEKQALEDRCEAKMRIWDLHNVGMYRDDYEIHKVKLDPLDHVGRH